MITVQITPETPSHMLRAIRAACNELLGEMHTDLTAQAAQHVTNANELQAAANAESCKAAAALSAHNATSITIIEPVEDNRQDRVPAVHIDEPAEETDSAGHTWNAELHSSSRAKVADGTWKKRRGAAVPDAPPVPPAPTAPAEPIMPKIFALITSQIVTINQAVEAAQAEGYADLGANGLGGAPREAQEAVLRKLEG